MWNLIAFYLVLELLIEAIYGALTFYHVGEGNVCSGSCLLGDALGIIVATQAPLRRRVHMRLIRIFEAEGAKASAAGIASLVGNCSPGKALTESASRFRGISLGQLSFESFLTS